MIVVFSKISKPISTTAVTIENGMSATVMQLFEQEDLKVSTKSYML